MKANLRDVSESDLARRRERGLDRWDEMWEGVLHMGPAPAFEHQRIQTMLAVFLVPLLEKTRRGTLVVGVNVFNDASPVEDYRIPDFAFVGVGHENLVESDGIHGKGLVAGRRNVRQAALLCRCRSARGHRGGSRFEETRGVSTRGRAVSRHRGGSRGLGDLGGAQGALSPHTR